MDVTSFDSQVALLREALDFFPRNEVDIYVPGAGILNMPTQVAPEDPAALANLKKPPQDLSASVINVNLSGVFVGTMLVARYGMGLHKAPEGGPKPTKSIVLIASLAGYCGAEGSVEYTTTKFGIRGLLRGFRKQLAGLGVRLNAVSPFYVETPMTSHAVPVLKEVGIPIATTEQVTEAVARVATDENAYGRQGPKRPVVILITLQVDRYSLCQRVFPTAEMILREVRGASPFLPKRLAITGQSWSTGQCRMKLPRRPGDHGRVMSTRTTDVL